MAKSITSFPPVGGSFNPPFDFKLLRVRGRFRSIFSRFQRFLRPLPVMLSFIRFFYVSYFSIGRLTRH
nr:MAG TPA: hypothetical protein [Caudoviricetes sp.]